MTAWCLVFVLGIAACAFGCSEWDSPIPDLPARPAATNVSATTVALEPDASLQAAARVTRFVVTPSRASDALPENFWVFSGELSSYYASRLARSELPETLLDRQVPTLAWPRGESIVVAPYTVLTPGDRYTLALLGYGVVLTIDVATDAPPAWSRLWPPPGAVSSGTYAIYCGEQPSDFAEAATTLEPGPWPVLTQAGIDERETASDRCLRLVALEPLPVELALMPPASLGNTPLDPTPLGTGALESGSPVACSELEAAFGPGCAAVQDDRVMLRVPPDPLLWIVRGFVEPWVRTSSSDATIAITGFEPASETELTVSTLDLAGRMTEDLVTIRTLPPTAHVVINEVLANPNGAEPAQEWVELYNDGAADADLTGFRFFDSGGETVLPAGVLRARGYALLVRLDYVEDSGTDPAPAPDTLLLRVAQLGRNGLSNQGEALRLETPDGSIVSRFPAVAQPQAGVSAVRRQPALADDDPTAFTRDPAGSATPGSSNRVD